MNIDQHFIAFANKYFSGHALRLDYEISPVAEIGAVDHEEMIMYFDDAVEEITCSPKQFKRISEIIGLGDVDDDCRRLMSSFFTMLNNHVVFKEIFHPIYIPSFENVLNPAAVLEQIELKYSKSFITAKPKLMSQKNKDDNLNRFDIQVSFPFFFTAESELKCLPVIALFYNTPYDIRFGINIKNKTFHPIVNPSTHYFEFFDNNPVMDDDCINKWCHQYLDDILSSFTPDFETSSSLNQKIKLAEMVLI